MLLVNSKRGETHGPQAAAGKPEKKDTDRGVQAIAIFKFVKGVLLIVAATGVLKLVDKDLPDMALGWLQALHVDADNRYAHGLLEKLMFLDARKLKEFSVGSYLYAALVFSEGTGLWLRKIWGEYLTIVATAVFIPFEIYENVQHFTFARLIVTFINVAVVVYLIAKLRRRKNEAR
jgi:uncharacterized membrane protein (DUF2068 family)